jgi:hypothetical protein
VARDNGKQCRGGKRAANEGCSKRCDGHVLW